MSAHIVERTLPKYYIAPIAVTIGESKHLCTGMKHIVKRHWMTLSVAYT